MSWVTPEQFAAQVILNVCELSDYTSPDDQPDLLQCTVKELEVCVLRAFEHFDAGTIPCAPCEACEGDVHCGHCLHEDRHHFDDGHGVTRCRAASDCQCARPAPSARQTP